MIDLLQYKGQLKTISKDDKTFVYQINTDGTLSKEKHSKELIVIQNSMIKTTPPGITNTAAYFTINNNSY